MRHHLTFIALMQSVVAKRNFCANYYL